MWNVLTVIWVWAGFCLKDQGSPTPGAAWSESTISLNTLLTEYCTSSRPAWRLTADWHWQYCTALNSWYRENSWPWADVTTGVSHKSFRHWIRPSNLSNCLSLQSTTFFYNISWLLNHERNVVSHIYVFSERVCGNFCQAVSLKFGFVKLIALQKVQYSDTSF